MFANKKITPGGHWIGITAIACKQTHADVVKQHRPMPNLDCPFMTVYLRLAGKIRS
jgi:hypothetical protein